MPFAWLSLSGSLFQTVGAALRNDLAPERVFVCVLAKARDAQSAQQEEQREQGRLYWETSSYRYCGAVLCTHGYVRQKILYSIRLVTGN